MTSKVYSPSPNKNPSRGLNQAAKISILSPDPGLTPSVTNIDDMRRVIQAVKNDGLFPIADKPMARVNTDSKKKGGKNKISPESSGEMIHTDKNKRKSGVQSYQSAESPRLNSQFSPHNEKGSSLSPKKSVDHSTVRESSPLRDKGRNSIGASPAKLKKVNSNSTVNMGSDSGSMRLKATGKASAASSNSPNQRILPAARLGSSAAQSNGKDAPSSGRLTRERKTRLMDYVRTLLGMPVGPVYLTDPRAIEAATALRLQPSHLRRLKAKFDAIDIDRSGSIDVDEFFAAIGEQRTAFGDQLFRLIDLDNSGTIEFNEFVRVLATYCMFSKDEILRFCFECFDSDGSGSIDEFEFMELVKYINNSSPTFPSNYTAALSQFDVNDDGLIDYSEFVEMEKRFPLVLFPAFRLQDFMQRSTLGSREWVSIMEDYSRRKYVEDYKATHGGRAPPETLAMSLLKTFFPCWYAERPYVPLGGAMEFKHRAGHDNDR